LPDNSGLKFVENGRYTDEKSVICGVIHLAWAFFGHIEYSGQHDRTAYWVQDGDVDAGVVNSEIINKMFADGRLRDGDIRILSTTPPHPAVIMRMPASATWQNRAARQPKQSYWTQELTAEIGRLFTRLPRAKPKVRVFFRALASS